MNWEQLLITKTALDLVAAGDEPNPVATGQQLAVLAKELGDLATCFRLGRDTVDRGLTGLEVHLVAMGFLAGEAVRTADWTDTAVYDPIRAMEKTVDMYIALLGLAALLGRRLGLTDTDLDAMAVARATGMAPGLERGS